MSEQGTETFGQMLKRFRERTPAHTSRPHWRSPACLSQNQLAIRAEISPGYVNRLEMDRSCDHRATEGVLPRRGTVLSLALALNLEDLDTDRLLLAAGLSPVEDWMSRALAAERTLRAYTEAERRRLGV